jgi:hypothetical protein
VHAVACEVDAERRLGQLGRHLLRRQRHLPAAVGVAVQAQILLV